MSMNFIQTPFERPDVHIDEISTTSTAAGAIVVTFVPDSGYTYWIVGLDVTQNSGAAKDVTCYVNNTVSGKNRRIFKESIQDKMIDGLLLPINKYNVLKATMTAAAAGETLTLRIMYIKLWTETT